jgi:hypothetical protein
MAAGLTTVVDPTAASSYLRRCRGPSTKVDQYGNRLRAAADQGLLPVAPFVSRRARVKSARTQACGAATTAAMASSGRCVRSNS